MRGYGVPFISLTGGCQHGAGLRFCLRALWHESLQTLAGSSFFKSLKINQNTIDKHTKNRYLENKPIK